MNTGYLIAFIIYFCILSLIGLWAYHKNKTASDFMIGDRSMNYWVTAIAAQASDMSSWLFLAFPAAIYTNGITEIWTAVGLVFFMFLNWHFIAPKIRIATEHYNSLTLASYFSSRYADTTGTIRLIAAIASLIFFTFYISSGLVGMGRIFQGTFDIPYTAGIIIGLLAALVYTVIGGFFAVAWCNLFQGIFMLVMLLIVPIYAFWQLEGFTTIVSTAALHHISLNLFSSGSGIAHSLALITGWGLGYFGQPHILIYFMSIDDPKKIPYAKYIGIAWMVIALLAAAAVGVVSLGYFPFYLSNPELLFIALAKQLFNPFLAGFVLCGIFAATLSTMNSHILISGSILAEDGYKRLIYPHASSTHILWVSRMSTIAVSLIALVIAVGNSNTIYDLVNYAWAGLGSSFGPLLILSLYSNRVTRAGAIGGIISGATISGLWPYVNTSIMPLIPGFGISLLTIVLLSKIRIFNEQHI